MCAYDRHENLLQSTSQSARGLALGCSFGPDIIFLDIGLPGIDGYAVPRQPRGIADVPAPVLIALTGWGSEEDQQRSRDTGFDHHLAKPVDADTVRALLALASGSNGGSQVTSW